MKSKLAIICPIGKTGNVVTMTLNYFLINELKLSDKLKAHEGENYQIEQYDEIAVIVPHTQVSVYPGRKDDGIDIHNPNKKIIWKDSGQQQRRRPQKNEGELQKQWNGGCWYEIIWVSSGGYKWHPKVEGLAHPDYNQVEPTTINNINCYLLPIHPKGSGEPPEIFTSDIVQDIDDEASNEQFQDLIYGLCAVLEELGYDIHISLAGGRKTMSAYQMTAAMLFSVDAGLSHVLEPTLPLLNGFIKSRELYTDTEKDQILRDQVQSAYQPYPELYKSVPVEHISLADVSNVIANQIGFRGNVDIMLGNLNGTNLKDIFTDPAGWKQIYLIGKEYRENLRDIDAKITEKIRQGLSAGLVRSFFAHDVKPAIFKRIRGDLDAIKRNPRERQKLEQVMHQIDLLDDTLSAIKKATEQEVQDIFANVKEGNTESVKAIIEMAIEMQEVKNLLALHKIDYEIDETPAKIKCDKALLALAFNNIVQNFIKVVKNLRNQEKATKERYKIKLTISEEQNMVTIRFVDDGPGFKGKDPNRFLKLGVTEYGDDGESQGLGLSMVKKIVNGHGGTITLDNVVDNGKVLGAVVEIKGLPIVKEGE